MLFHLALGLHHETQADAVACPPRSQADGKGAGIPERVQQTGPGAQIGQAVLGPGQVVGLLTPGRLHLGAQDRAAGGQRLGGIQRLGADFTDVVHPHQRA